MLSNTIVGRSVLDCLNDAAWPCGRTSAPPGLGAALGACDGKSRRGTKLKKRRPTDEIGAAGILYVEQGTTRVGLRARGVSSVKRSFVMASPVVHFEAIGTNPDQLRRYYGDLFDWTFDTPSPRRGGGLTSRQLWVSGPGQIGRREWHPGRHWRRRGLRQPCRLLCRRARCRSRA